MMDYIKDKFRIQRFRARWREKNGHNSTKAKRVFFIENVKVGKGTYGYIDVYNDVSTSRLNIANFCSIADGVVFLLGHDHPMNNVSSFPFRAKVLNICYSEAVSKGDIIIDDDVWIGFNATIMSGVHIGQGAVVAAGAVVSKDVPPYAIVGGVPAKVIRYRFCPEVIEFLLTLDYGALDEQMISEHVEDLYGEIDGMELEEIKKLFAWFPKKDVNS